MELSKQSNHQNPPDRLLITLRLSFWNRRRSVDVECDLTLLLEKVNVSGWNWTAPQGPVVEWKHQLGSGDLVCFDSETCGGRNGATKHRFGHFNAAMPLKTAPLSEILKCQKTLFEKSVQQRLAQLPDRLWQTSISYGLIRLMGRIGSIFCSSLRRES